MKNNKEKKILIVDCNDINRCYLTRILSTDGYEIKEACSGKEALEKSRD